MKRRAWLWSLTLGLMLAAALAPECGAAAVWYDYECGESVTARLEDGVLTVSGTGPMADYARIEELPWYDFSSDPRQTITRVVVEEGVTGIGDYAFCGCTNLESVSLPRGLARIGARAFYGDGKLAGLELPDGLREIEEEAFYPCGSIRELRLPEGLKRVELNAFAGTGVTHVDVPEGVTRLLGFAHCEQLKSVALPDSVMELSFAGCKGLEACDVPSGVTRLDGTFNGCAALRRVSLPEGLTEIGYRAFYSCGSLTSVSFPESLETIGTDAFRYCRGIQEFRFPANVKEIGASCFYNCSLERVIYESEDLTEMKTGYDIFGGGGPLYVYFAGNRDRWNSACGGSREGQTIFYNSQGPAEGDLSVRDGALAGSVFVPMKAPGSISRCYAVCMDTVYPSYGRPLDIVECAVETADGGLRARLSMRPEGTEGKRRIKLLFLDEELRPVHSAAGLEDLV